jgi:hypothetical protein
LRFEIDLFKNVRGAGGTSVPTHRDRGSHIRLAGFSIDALLADVVLEILETDFAFVVDSGVNRVDAVIHGLIQGFRPARDIDLPVEQLRLRFACELRQLADELLALFTRDEMK